MSRRLLFIYNPHAGKGQLKNNLADIIDIFVKENCEVTVYPTQGYMDAYDKVKSFEDHYDLLVCSGGDGTLDETVTGMMLRENKIPIGYIPTGTTNDFASSLHISRNLLEAAKTAVCGQVFSCDVGGFNKDTFVYIAAFGLFTDVSYQTKQEMKNVLGHLAYVLEGVKRLYSIKSYHIKAEHDGEVIEDEIVFGMVTNSKSVGGFRSMIGSNVVFDDGEFEVTLIKRPRNPLELQEIIAALLIEQVNSKYMYTFKTGRLVIESEEEIPWTLDGEFGGDHIRVEIVNKKQALKIMVDPEKIPDLTSIPELGVRTELPEGQEA